MIAQQDGTSRLSYPALKNLGSVRLGSPSKPRNVRVINFDPSGKAYHIMDIVKGRYYYPKGVGAVLLRPSFLRSPLNSDPGGQGEISPSPRSLKEGEIGEWILLDAVSSMYYGVLDENLISDSIFRPPLHVLISPCTTSFPERSILL